MYVTGIMKPLGAGVESICIAQYFCPEKIFTFFAQAHRGRNFFRRIILLSEHFATLKLLPVHDFTRGCQAVLTVPHGHQLFLTIRKRSLYRSAS